MQNYPKISIITPSFNQGHFIEQTITSVIGQNYPNLEYIVIDAGSTDATVDIIKKYEKHISYWISEPDKGQSDAINKGLKIATGDIINWLNSDDYYEPNALFKIAEAFMQNPNAMAVCAKSRIFRNENDTVKYSTGTDIYPGNLARTIGWARIDQPETFFRNSAVQKMGLLDVELCYLMDRDWWIKYLFAFGIDRIKILDDVVVHFRLHNESKTVSQGSLFQKEHDTWFYALALKHGLGYYADCIAANFEIKKGFEIKNLEVQDVQLVEASLNCYLLLRANELYESGDRSKTSRVIDSIKFLAHKEDHTLARKIRLYNKLYVKRIKNLLIFGK